MLLSFNCWIYDGHWVRNHHSILSNYFADLYASPNQKITKAVSEDVIPGACFREYT